MGGDDDEEPGDERDEERDEGEEGVGESAGEEVLEFEAGLGGEDDGRDGGFLGKDFEGCREEDLFSLGAGDGAVAEALGGGADGGVGPGAVDARGY